MTDAGNAARDSRTPSNEALPEHVRLDQWARKLHPGYEVIVPAGVSRRLPSGSHAVVLEAAVARGCAIVTVVPVVGSGWAARFTLTALGREIRPCPPGERRVSMKSRKRIVKAHRTPSDDDS